MSKRRSAAFRRSRAKPGRGERSLKEIAYRIEDDLAALPTVSQVETSGVRNYEISIEVPLRRLRALGLTLTDVANPD